MINFMQSSRDREVRAHTLSLFDLLAKFTINPSNGSFVLDSRVQYSLETGAVFLESMTGTGIRVEFSGGSSKDYLNLNSGTDYSDVQLASYEYAVVVDKGGFWSPWLQIEGPSAASLKLLFPLHFDYTKSPPTKIPANIQFFQDWVSTNGQSFYLSH
jgi:hypothetical protein